MKNSTQHEDKDSSLEKIKISRLNTFLKKLKSTFQKYFSFRKTERALTLITSTIFRLAIILIFFLISIFLYKEFTDKSYHIQEFQVPPHFAEMGYNGGVLAHKLEIYVNDYIAVANRTWSEKEIEVYNQSADRTQVKVEVSGVGFSPQSVVQSIKHAFGIPSREITGEIVYDGSELILTIKVTGNQTMQVFQPVDKTSEGKSLEALIKKGAKRVLENNNPLILGIFYSGRLSRSDEPHSDSLGIQMFRQTIVKKPNQAATAYAWWARSIINATGDSVYALNRVKKSLSLDPDNAFAYRVWAGIRIGQNDFAGGEKLMLRSLKLDPTSGSNWAVLGNIYYNRDGEKDVEAMDCYEKAISLEPINGYEKNLAELYYYHERYVEALELLENLENNGWAFGEPLRFFILKALNDSLGEKRELEWQRIDSRTPRELSDRFNRFAVGLTIRKKWDMALTATQIAVEADTTNAYPYTTLADIYGLQGNDELFYQNLEKAVSLGLDMNEINEKTEEPYKKYASQQRYKLLKTKK